jgi:hypothetical protein
MVSPYCVFPQKVVRDHPWLRVEALVGEPATLRVGTQIR